MAQSDVQTLIQQLAGIQTTAQNGASNAANNGNPNTVYNQSAWGYGGPPTMNAQGGGVSANNYSRPASTTLGSWTPPTGPVGVGTGGPLVPINGGGIPTVPGWNPQPPASPVTPPTAPPVAPPVTPPATPPLAPPAGTGGYDGNINGGIAQDGFGGLAGQLGGLRGTSGSNFTHTIPQGGFGGLSQLLGGANLTWQAVADAFLPGDLYDSRSGKWDITNIVAQSLNYVLPGLGTAMSWLGREGLLGQRIQDFGYNESMRQFDARFQDNIAQSADKTRDIMNDRTARSIFERAAPRMNPFMPSGQGWQPGVLISSITGKPLGSSFFDSEYNGDINTRMDSWGTGGAPQRDSRSGNSVGSSVVWSADGDSGKSFGGNGERLWQDEMAGQATDAMKNMFRNAEQ